MDNPQIKKILELLLWMSDRPLQKSDFKSILGDDYTSDEAVAELIAEIGRELDQRESPMQVMAVANGYQMASRAAYSTWVRRLFKEKTTLRLSISAMETLSIIAYKQPITRGEIEEIRGVEVTGVLETLLERKFVKIMGRKETLGRPLLYGTTIDFMRQFGLKTLNDLPRLEELIPPDDTVSPGPGSPDTAPSTSPDAPPAEPAS
ncbi:MAG TPA: SMC-Scp complex subunit ScpB [Elusimicrobiota bacterium]|nr:SMC-Scp complex subunit ScpB [Elusimicrobiota bacterium]